MIRITPTRSALSGERGIALSKHFSRSLSAQLMGGVLLSLLAAMLVFALCSFAGSILLGQTVYGKTFENQMANRQFSELQNYVEREKITINNLHRLNAWCSRGDQVYLTVYVNGVIRYESPIAATGELEEDDFDVSFENPDREYSLQLSDGPRHFYTTMPETLITTGLWSSLLCWPLQHFLFALSYLSTGNCGM